MIVAQAMLNAGKTPIILPARDKDGKLNAIIEYAAAVRRNSPNQDLAYALIRTILDPALLASDDLYSATHYFTPVVDSIADSVLDRYEFDLDNADRSFVSVSTGALSDEKGLDTQFVEAYKDLKHQLDSASLLYPGAVVTVITKAAKPYLEGDATVEDVLPALREQIELYISE